MVNFSSIERALSDVKVDFPLNDIYRLIRYSKLDALPVLSKYLSSNLPIEIIEKYETITKMLLYGYLSSGNVTSEGARDIALFQKNTGFILKYKTYTVKATTPLGYSIFLHKPNEGFSFQRHTDQKLEIFHILEVLEGGYVFICDYNVWFNNYDKESFSAWLNGTSDPRYDPYRFYPQPGDVFCINRLNLVHSVVGCILDEFATTSFDMVDRLHDQNASKEVITEINRDIIVNKIKALNRPKTARMIHISKNGPRIEQLRPKKVLGGQSLVMSKEPILAQSYEIEQFAESDLMHYPDKLTSLFVSEGSGQIIIGTKQEVNSLSVPLIELNKGDILTVPNNIYYRLLSSENDTLSITQHSVSTDIALT